MEVVSGSGRGIVGGSGDIGDGGDDEVGRGGGRSVIVGLVVVPGSSEVAPEAGVGECIRRDRYVLFEIAVSRSGGWNVDGNGVR
jgi:hypothetical protein